jgi:hypothetical protein
MHDARLRPAAWPLIGSPEPLIGSPNPLIGSPNPLIGSPNPLIGSPEPVCALGVIRGQRLRTLFAAGRECAR